MWLGKRGETGTADVEIDLDRTKVPHKRKVMNLGAGPKEASLSQEALTHRCTTWRVGTDRSTELPRRKGARKDDKRKKRADVV